MSIQGAAHVTLADLDGWAQGDVIRERLHRVCLVPDGARLILDVGRRVPSSEAVRFLREHVERLHIEIRADPALVKEWLDAVSGRDGIFQAAANV